MPPIAATALGSAQKASPELVAEVVGEAMVSAGTDIARGVLLFLSSEFARIAQPAVLAASRVARCIQVAGCTAPGVFTEVDWILDRPAACAMVCGAGISVGPAGDLAGQAVLTLAVPQAAGIDWIASRHRRFGMLSADGAAQNPGRVWSHASVCAEGKAEVSIGGARSSIAVSRGLRLLGESARVDSVEGYDLYRVGGHPALSTLLRELPLELREMVRLPHHLLFAGVVDAQGEEPIDQDRFDLVPVIAANAEDRSVTLGGRIQAGARMFWCMRQPLAAERDTRVALDAAAAELGGAPDFGVAFSCVGRGPYFFGGPDRDLEILRERFPGMPFIGAYGAGEIGTPAAASRLLLNSAVFALFRRDV
jgi:small ligand-binding sensory domain FIST